MELLAYKELSPRSRLAIFELDKLYWTAEQRNPMMLPELWLSQYLGCCKTTAAKVLCELMDYGWLVREERGKLRGPVPGRSSVYRLTWRHCNVMSVRTFDYRKVSKQLEKKRRE